MITKQSVAWDEISTGDLCPLFHISFQLEITAINSTLCIIMKGS